MNALRFALVSAAALLLAAPALAQKASIALLQVVPTDGLLLDVQSQGDRQARALLLLTDSITSSMPGKVNDTGKFDVVALQDLEAVLGVIEQQEVLANPSDPRVAQAFQTAGIEYTIVVRVEQYDDRETSATIGGALNIRRELQMAATISVIKAETGVLQATLSYRPQPKIQGREMVGGAGDGAGVGNEMVIAYGDEAGEGIAGKLLEYFFPMRAVRVRGDVLTINRGAAAGVTVGQRLEIIEASEFEDPDTGEILLDEFPIGVAEVTRTAPQSSNARIVEGDPAEIERIMSGDDVRLILRPMN